MRLGGERGPVAHPIRVFFVAMLAVIALTVSVWQAPAAAVMLILGYALAGLAVLGPAGSLMIISLIGVWFALYYPPVIRKEEAKLAELHGNAYTAYRRSTPPFFPRLTRFREGAVYRVQPARIRANSVDYVWMIWGLGLVQLFALLHRGGLLPVLSRIY